jgi:hypothetical protein
MNTRDGKFFSNAYYPYNQGYMEDNVKGLAGQPVLKALRSESQRNSLTV